MTFGAFDLLHFGHMRLLERIAAMADHLTVALASDELVSASGRKTVLLPYAMRREMLLQLRSVDAVIEHAGTQDHSGPVKLIQAKIDLVLEHQIQLVVMGSDWQGAYDFLQPWCKVCYLERTPGISSSWIKAQLAQQINKNKESSQPIQHR